MKSEEIIYQKVFVSPRPPPKISCTDNWMCDLDSDVAGNSKDTQRIQSKPQTQLSSTVRPVGGQESTKEIEQCILFDHDTLSQEKHDEVTDSKSTGRPVCGPESTKRCVLTPKHVEEDQTGTGRPVLVDQKKEHEIDFRVPGLSRAVVKEAEHLRVQELVKKIKKIFIEKHFMPTCSRITSATHSAKNRRRWSSNWVMWSYSSCAKLYQKYNVLTVFCIGMKELCTALADTAWSTANPEESLTN